MKSLIPQQVMSPASTLIAQLMQPISQPMTVHHKSNIRRKGGKNYGKIVKIKKKLL